MVQEQQQSAAVPTSRARFVASAVVLVGVLCAGWLGGWTASSQRTTAAGHGHGEEAEAGHEGHEHGARAPKISARALANLGVEIGEVALSDFVRTVEVPAEVEPWPLSERPITTPLAGIVQRVLAGPGQAVPAGAPLAEILRDPFPSPLLALTQALLQPLNEEYHATLQALRSASLSVALAQSELSRLRPADAAAGVGGRVLREAEYAEQRALRELENARREAQRHGLSPEQVAALEHGDASVELPDSPDLKRVLARNHLWSAEAEALLALLPEAARGSPQTVAVLGELVGAGRLTPALVATLVRTPALAAAWADIAGLVQQGATTAALEALAERGALAPIVVLTAPADGGPSWDLTSLRLRAGERVEAGAEVARVRDDREMALHLHAAPSDLAPLEQAVRDGASLEAEPLVAGAGPTLKDVRILSLTGRHEDAPAGALASASNSVVAEREAPGGGRVRTWALRPGMRLAVRVPTQRLAGRFVLPADAIAYKGAEAVVLLPDGDAFRVVPVRLEHHDARVAVVAADGAVFPGDRVVVHGAPSLGMALLASQGGVDPHAGHNH